MIVSYLNFQGGKERNWGLCREGELVDSRGFWGWVEFY